jgi:alpha 1,3-glucosidase
MILFIFSINYFIYFRSLDATAKFETDAWIERVVILGYPKTPNKVTINSGDKQAIPLHSYQVASQALIIRRPGPPVGSDWTLSIS